MNNTSWRDELIWSAGFFDGEGHIGVHKGQHSQGPWTRIDLYLNISQTDRYVLDRFRSAVGVGRVSGPYVRSARNPNERDVFYYQLTRFEHIQAVVGMLWDFLSPIKRRQCRDALIAIRDRPNHRRTCKHGHPRTPENTYVSGKVKWCKPCRLAQQKASRDNLKLVKSESA